MREQEGPNKHVQSSQGFTFCFPSPYCITQASSRPSKRVLFNAYFSTKIHVVVLLMSTTTYVFVEKKENYNVDTPLLSGPMS